MAEINNKTLALLVVAALAVVIVATGIQLNQMSRLGLTGMAPTDTGDVMLTVEDALNIQVISPNDTIDFGTCSPNGTLTWVSSDNSTDDSSGICNGTAAAGLDSIQLRNIGNVDANISVEGECAIASWLPENAGADADFQIRINGSGCAVGAQTTFTSLGMAGINVCENHTYGDDFYLWARVVIPPDALTSQNCGGNAINTLQFNATSIM